MIVASAIAPGSATPTSTAATGSSTLNYNSFLTLLISEMKNQDPTKPMDPTQMVSQLATVSEVGQAVQTNANLTSLLAGTQILEAEQLVGKSLTSADGGTTGQVASVTVSSTGETATLTDGKTVTLGAGVRLGGP